MHLSLLAVMCSGLSRKAGNDLPPSGQLQEYDTRREACVWLPAVGVRAPVLLRGMQALLEQESRHAVTPWAGQESHPGHSVSHRASFKGLLTNC